MHALFVCVCCCLFCSATFGSCRRRSRRAVCSISLSHSLSLFAPQKLRLSFALLTTVVVAFVVLANVVTVLLLLVVFSLPRKISFVYLCICQAFCAAGDCSALASTSSFSSSTSSFFSFSSSTSSNVVKALSAICRESAT